LGYVKYVGSHNATSGINYFRGIPYAQPPLGSLRWHKPRPIEENNHFNGQTFDATTPAPMCYQSNPLSLDAAFDQLGLAHNGIPIGNQSEDCLILDVLVPDKPVSGRLPVMVQIHGGGYTIGSAGSTPGDGIVHASEGKIIGIS
jgi:carboxylesterase type B